MRYSLVMMTEPGMSHAQQVCHRRRVENAEMKTERRASRSLLGETVPRERALRWGTTPEAGFSGRTMKPDDESLASHARREWL